MIQEVFIINLNLLRKIIILELITPIVFNICNGVQSRLDFIDLSIKSVNLIGNSRKIDVNESFSSYLKDLKTWIIINLNLIVLFL